MKNLAHCTDYEGSGQSPEQLYRSALVSRRRALGITHPDSLESASRLAVYLHAGERLAEAAELYRTVLVHRVQVLGRAHPSTDRTAYNLSLSEIRLQQTVSLSAQTATTGQGD